MSAHHVKYNGTITTLQPESVPCANASYRITTLISGRREATLRRRLEMP